MTSKGGGLLRSNLPLGDTLLRGASYFVTVQYTYALGIHVCANDLAPRTSMYFPSILSTFPIHVSWKPDQSYDVKMARW